MARGFLRVRTVDQPERRVPVGRFLVIGRTADCGLIIDDGAASRRHVEVAYDEKVFTWKDLDSTNGTLINSIPQQSGTLKHGDRIQIGETILLFEIEQADESANTRMSNSAVLTSDFRSTDGRISGGPGDAKSTDLLRAVYSVMNEIASNYEPCSLVNEILKTTMKAVDAQRGAVFFGDETSDELRPCPVCSQVHMIERGNLRPAQQGEIKISRTTVYNVLREGESILYRDTGLDQAQNIAESIMALNLRSIICVPMRGKFGILGVLYMDTDRADQQYTHDDMLLSTAVGNSAGLAIENAHMHQEILEKQRTDQEIEVAWSIQEGFLVKEWDTKDKRFEVYGEMRPAKIVGGDFYDFVTTGQGKVGILIGDVSGKGVPAALTMAQLLAEFRLCVANVDSPREVLSVLNEDLAQRSQRGTFCTLAYLVVDLDTGQAVCANAGHSAAILMGKNAAAEWAEASGPPIGIVPGATWQDEAIQLEAGDSLFFYTDGISEARTMELMGDHPDEFGVNRLCKLADQHKGSHPRQLLDTVNEHVVQFCAPDAPHDDCTMIALRYLG